MGGFYQTDQYGTEPGTYSGTQYANRRFDHLAYANALANDVAASRWLMAANAVEDPRSRAARLLSDARARHPEWTVKKLQKPC